MAAPREWQILEPRENSSMAVFIFSPFGFCNRMRKVTMVSIGSSSWPHGVSTGHVISVSVGIWMGRCNNGWCSDCVRVCDWWGVGRCFTARGSLGRVIETVADGDILVDTNGMWRCRRHGGAVNVEKKDVIRL
jgi:hypothetical protein